MWSVFLWVLAYVIKIHYNNYPFFIFLMLWWLDLGWLPVATKSLSQSPLHQQDGGENEKKWREKNSEIT